MGYLQYTLRSTFYLQYVAPLCPLPRQSAETLQDCKARTRDRLDAFKGLLVDNGPVVPKSSDESKVRCLFLS